MTSSTVALLEFIFGLLDPTSFLPDFRSALLDHLVEAPPAALPDTTRLSAAPSAVLIWWEDDGLHLFWSAGPTDETSGYRIHRLASEEEVPADSTQVGFTRDAEFLDPQAPRDRKSWYVVEAMSRDGRVGVPSRLRRVDPPAEWKASPEVSLGSAYPNPFRISTRLRVEASPDIPAVEASIFDLRGRRIRDLGRMPDGLQIWEVQWDGSDNRGRRVAAGAYRMQLRGRGMRISRGVVVLP